MMHLLDMPYFVMHKSDISDYMMHYVRSHDAYIRYVRYNCRFIISGIINHRNIIQVNNYIVINRKKEKKEKWGLNRHENKNACQELHREMWTSHPDSWWRPLAPSGNPHTSSSPARSGTG